MYYLVQDRNVMLENMTHSSPRWLCSLSYTKSRMIIVAAMTYLLINKQVVSNAPKFNGFKSKIDVELHILILTGFKLNFTEIKKKNNTKIPLEIYKTKVNTCGLVLWFRNIS